MNGFEFSLADARLTALPSGALWWAAARILTVSDLHLGKAERLARRGGALLPPYDTTETLSRLEADIGRTDPTTVICLGDSFDDDAAASALPPPAEERLMRMMAGRRWIWIAGNHDPGPTTLGGTHLAELKEPPLTFRHAAEPCAAAEISGHYHPKRRLAVGGRRVTRPCFLIDGTRVVLPAFGAYTGGLPTDAAALDRLMAPGAIAVLTGPRATPVPMRGGPGRPPRPRPGSCG